MGNREQPEFANRNDYLSDWEIALEMPEKRDLDEIEGLLDLIEQDQFEYINNASPIENELSLTQKKSLKEKLTSLLDRKCPVITKSMLPILYEAIDIYADVLTRD